MLGSDTESIRKYIAWLLNECACLQVIHDVDLQKLPVRFAMDRAGLVGADGPTHCGAFDVAYMACLPNMVVMAPADEAELFHMVATAAAIDDRPSCFRYPRGNGLGVLLPEGNKGIPIKVGLGFGPHAALCLWVFPTSLPPLLLLFWLVVNFSAVSSFAIACISVSQSVIKFIISSKFKFGSAVLKF
jgi:hypothetical protein